MKTVFVATALVLTTSTAFAYDYRDRNGVRHWNHFGHRHHYHPRVRVVQDRHRFVEVPEAVPKALEAKQLPVVSDEKPPISDRAPDTSPPSWAGVLVPCCRNR